MSKTRRGLQNEIRKQSTSRDPKGFIGLFSIYGMERQPVQSSHFVPMGVLFLVFFFTIFLNVMILDEVKTT